MGSYQFRKDLKVAKASEEEAAALLTSIYGAEILDFEDTNKYDILAKINEKLHTFEVKEDFYCEKSGNIGVEFECRGKPSGIAVSESDFYIYKIHLPQNNIKYAMHKTSRLKESIAKKEYFRVATGGDPGSNTKMYLFKLEKFLATGYLLVSPNS